MQTKIIGCWRLVLVLAMAGLPLDAGSARASEPGVVTGTAAATDIGVAQAGTAPPSDQSAPPEVKLSKGAAEIVKLAQAGLGEEVMLAYVGNVTSKFNLGSDQIVYLNDLGISGAVVKEMIQRDASLEAASRAATASLLTPVIPPAPTNAYPPDVASGGSLPPAPPMDNSDASNNSGDYTTANDSDFFYNSLAPYGSWIYVTGCGRCWQPTVCLGNRDWRPYGDRGRWLSSDCGWYWQSDYSWGWAPFHYGRWFTDANRGWVWAPDRVWGPAWVSWRHSADFCGWAPLPRSARFVPGAGFFHANHAVGADFEFGLQASHYTFIPLERLCDYSPARYAVPAWQAGQVHGQTAVINHFAFQNNRVVNHGIDPREVADLSRTEIRRAEIREMPRDANKAVQPDRLTKSGGGLVIFRPQLPPPGARQTVGAVGSGNRQFFAPARNVGTPKTSMNEQRNSEPLPAVTPASYPPGSLVLIGRRDARGLQSSSSAPLPNMNLAHLANHGVAAEQPVQSDMAYPARSSAAYAAAPQAANGPQSTGPSAGFNFNGNFGRPHFQEHFMTQNTPAQREAPLVMPARFSVAQHLSANPPQNFVAPSFSNSERVHSQSASNPSGNTVAAQMRAAAAGNLPSIQPQSAPASGQSHHGSHDESHTALMARSEPAPAMPAHAPFSPSPAPSSSGSGRR